MKKSTILLCLYFSIIILLSSCATICGGGSYFAHVTVPGHPNAMIYTSRNKPEGKGSAVFKVSRKDANKFSLTVKEEGCEEQMFNFNKRTFRGWALAGSIVTFTGIVQGIPLPWGVAVDLINGAYWKPNILEKYVTKQDFRHYNYTLEYQGCKTRDETPKIIEKLKEATPLKETTKSKVERLREMKKLLDEGILTQEEFNKEKEKILGE